MNDTSSSTIQPLARVFVDVDASLTKPIEWVFVHCQKENEHVFKWLQVPTVSTLYPGMSSVVFFIVDCTFPEELNSSMKRLTTALSSQQTEADHQLEALKQEYELYKKRSKAATVLLQEKSTSASDQLQSFQAEVSCITAVIT